MNFLMAFHGYCSRGSFAYSRILPLDTVFPVGQAGVGFFEMSMKSTSYKKHCVNFKIILDQSILNTRVNGSSSPTNPSVFPAVIIFDFDCRLLPQWWELWPQKLGALWSPFQGDQQ